MKYITIVFKIKLFLFLFLLSYPLSNPNSFLLLFKFLEVFIFDRLHSLSKIFQHTPPLLFVCLLPNYSLELHESYIFVLFFIITMEVPSLTHIQLMDIKL